MFHWQFRTPPKKQRCRLHLTRRKTLEKQNLSILDINNALNAYKSRFASVLPGSKDTMSLALNCKTNSVSIFRRALDLASYAFKVAGPTNWKEVASMQSYCAEGTCFIWRAKLGRSKASWNGFWQLDDPRDFTAESGRKRPWSLFSFPASETKTEGSLLERGLPFRKQSVVFNEWNKTF